MAAKRKTLLLDHDELVAQLLALRDQLAREQVVAAFVSSLRGKALELRSPLGSYAFHLNHPAHTLDPFDPSAGTMGYLGCTRCAYFSNKGRREVELSLAYYAKLRRESTSGDNFSSPSYALADLMLFAKAGAPSPDESDWELLRQLLERLHGLPASARKGDLIKALAGLVPGDRYVRQQLLEILGFCGILQPRSIPPVTERFFYQDEFESPTRLHTGDWVYPVSWWSGADGVNQQAVELWFGKRAG